MSTQDEAVRRALEALNGADEHPGHDVLEAYVEGRLAPAERARIDGLAARSPMIAEDIADLQAVHRDLASNERRNSGETQPAAARRDVRWRIAAVAAVAATVVVGMWLVPMRLQAPAPVASRLTVEEDARVKALMAAGRIPLAPQIAALAPPEGTLLGAAVQPARFTLQAPRGTAVTSARPQFTWSDAGADAYTVAVFDPNFIDVARARVTGTSWTPDVDLPRGTTYSWQVTAHRGTDNDTEPKPPRAEARFHVIDAATMDRVADIRRRVDADDPLALAILLADNGLIADARVELARALQIPRTADVAGRLLASLDQGTPITTKPAQ